MHHHRPSQQKNPKLKMEANESVASGSNANKNSFRVGPNPSRSNPLLASQILLAALSLHHLVFRVLAREMVQEV
jgi:hypothetical protein